MFTKQHYKFLADFIKGLDISAKPDPCSYLDTGSVALLRVLIANSLAEDNLAFSKSKFIAAAQSDS